MDKKFAAKLRKSRQGRVDLRGNAELRGVLRHPRPRQSARDRRRHAVYERIHGDGWRHHKLPVKADVRKAIGKQAGDTVKVHLEQRIEG